MSVPRGGCIYYRQEGNEVCLLIGLSGKLFGQSFQSQVALWQAEVFSLKGLSMPCNTQRQLSFIFRKGSFTDLHTNRVDASA